MYKEEIQRIESKTNFYILVITAKEGRKSS